MPDALDGHLLHFEARALRGVCRRSRDDRLRRDAPTANLASEKVQVEYIPSEISLNEIKHTIEESGFKVLKVPPEKKLEDVEKVVREKEEQSLPFSLPDLPRTHRSIYPDVGDAHAIEHLLGPSQVPRSKDTTDIESGRDAISDHLPLRYLLDPKAA